MGKAATRGVVSQGGAPWLLAAQLGKRVLQRLDQPLHILRRHIDPSRGHRQTCRCLGRVLDADERLAAHNACADAGELKEGRGSHGAMVAWKAHSWQPVVQISKGFRSRPSIHRGARPRPVQVSPVLGFRYRAFGGVFSAKRSPTLRSWCFTRARAASIASSLMAP